MLTLIRCPLNHIVTAVAHKRPRPFCQKCRWQVTPKHAYTHDISKSEWDDNAAVQSECGNLSGNELTRNSSGNTRPQLSHFAKPLWTEPGRMSGISVSGLISRRRRRRRKHGRRMNCRTFSQDPLKRGKSHHHHHLLLQVLTAHHFSKVTFST